MMRTMDDIGPNDTEALALSLEATGDFRVLRRLRDPLSPPVNDGPDVRRGLFVDVETTGLDPDCDEIIELAMVRFHYATDGRIFGLGEIFEGLRQPSSPIPAAITALTGITDEMVVGRSIDLSAMQALVAETDLVIAHNAGFDRRFLERLDPVFASKPWACSMSQIDWAGEGFEGVKLAYLAMGAGFFYDRHRAKNDCLAAIELLSRTLPVSGDLALKRMLYRARKHGWRVWAVDTPFAKKDEIKRRLYKWNGDSRLGPKAWYIDVDDDGREAELAFLRDEIYRDERHVDCRRVTALERFSDRLA